jgi:ArsR family metal-binding transcriptional regulator
VKYLDAITLTRALPCLAEPGKIIVIAKPNRPLDEVLPYLATLPGITPALEPQAVRPVLRVAAGARRACAVQVSPTTPPHTL